MMEIFVRDNDKTKARDFVRKNLRTRRLPMFISKARKGIVVDIDDDDIDDFVVVLAQNGFSFEAAD